MLLEAGSPNSGLGKIIILIYSLDGFSLRTIGHTTARVSSFLYFYDWFNKDPRRLARFDYMLYAGLLGGVVAGIATAPLDCVFTRMQVDEMYPEGYRRNYSSFLDGLQKTANEGALFRGALANGLKLGLMCATMTNTFDMMKENSYFWIGPSTMNRFYATAVTCILGIALSQPFD